MRLSSIAVMLIGMAAAGSSQATVNAVADDRIPIQVDVKQSISEQLSGVEDAISSERYSELTDEDRAAVRDALGRIRSNVGDASSVDSLTPNERTAVFNDQEIINTVMGRAHADSRLVCERVRTTGSNRREQVCITVAQRRELRENSRDVLRNWNYWNIEKD